MNKIKDIVKVNEKAFDVITKQLAQERRQKWIENCKVDVLYDDGVDNKITYKGLYSAACDIYDFASLGVFPKACSMPYTIRYDAMKGKTDTPYNNSKVIGRAGDLRSLMDRYQDPDILFFMIVIIKGVKFVFLTK